MKYIIYFYNVYVIGKVNYIVVGEDPGPSKLDKARGYNITEIDEDHLLDLILTKSGMKPKFSKMQSEKSCDSGLGISAANSFDDSPRKKKNDSEKMKEEKLNVDNDNTRKSKSLKTLEVSYENSKKKYAKTDVESKNELNTNSSKKEKKPVIREEESTKQEKKEDVPKIKEEKQSTDENKLKTNSTVDFKESSERKTSSTYPQEIPSKQILEGNLAWADKYKPKDLKSIIGQQDGASNLNKLKKWLMNWYRNQEPHVRKKIVKPSPWAKNDDGAYYKAVLLSGPPGVGENIFKG